MELVREICGKISITDKNKTKRYLEEFKKEDREFFIVLGLDSNNKVMYRDIVSIGTLNSCLIHPREVFKSAIMKSANSIIVAHNHPSGNPEPSTEDKNIFDKLKEAGKIIDIPVLDSIIIAGNKLISLNEEV